MTDAQAATRHAPWQAAAGAAGSHHSGPQHSPSRDLARARAHARAKPHARAAQSAWGDGGCLGSSRRSPRSGWSGWNLPNPTREGVNHAIGTAQSQRNAHRPARSRARVGGHGRRTDASRQSTREPLGGGASTGNQGQPTFGPWGVASVLTPSPLSRTAQSAVVPLRIEGRCPATATRCSTMR